MRNRESDLHGEAHAPIWPQAVELARSQLAAPGTYREVSAIFAALADPTRAAIVHALSRQELCTTDLALVIGISRPAASQHLRVLRDLRLVRTRRERRLVIYHLEDLHVAELIQLGLTHEAEGSR